MKQYFYAFILIFQVSSIDAQSIDSQAVFNFDFEQVENNFPVNCETFGGPGYRVQADSMHYTSGNYSVSIEFQGKDLDFKTVSITIPESYPGEKITLTGRIRTENVSGGWAGLWMRIDPSIAFSNMYSEGITGTTGWEKYEITLDMNPEMTNKIMIGGLLVGKGRMWLDDLQVLIDGQDIRKLTPLKTRKFPALQDKAFDEGSGIEKITYDRATVKDLKVLGLIWGFLKYYHPNIAKGDYNWDYELFRILPELLETTDQKNRDKLLTEWILGLGEFEVKQKKDAPSGEVKIKPDLDWIEDSGFSEELTGLLLEVKDAKRTGEHFYVALKPGVKNPQFTNEKAYRSMVYPDAGFRILALYKYWNIIQYYFPYKNLIEEDWKGVLGEFIPVFTDAADETEYTLGMLKLVTRIHDSHAFVWERNGILKKYRGLNYAPLKIKFIEDQAVVTGYYNDESGDKTGLQTGDVILKINGRPVDAIIEMQLKITPASNYPGKLKAIATNLLRTNDSTIDLTYRSNGVVTRKRMNAYSTSQLNITRINAPKDTCFKLLRPGIAYLHSGTLKNEHLPTIWEHVKDTEGLIIDLRCYPSDFTVYSLGKHLMPDSTEFAKVTAGSIISPGLFTFRPALKVGEPNPDYYKGKVVILVDENTLSSAEFTAMAFSAAPDATIIGSTTAGADGNVSGFTLPGDISTNFSGVGVYYPDGRETQRIGIVPDINVSPTIEGIKNNRDEVLEKAIEFIDEK